MSEHQQQQAQWEWRDQEEERWHAENIQYADRHASMSKLATAQPIIDQMLAQFDSVFGTDKESI